MPAVDEGAAAEEVADLEAALEVAALEVAAKVPAARQMSARRDLLENIVKADVKLDNKRQRM